MLNLSVKFNDQQLELLDIRKSRQLYKLCSELKLHSLIGATTCESELVSIVKKYGISDMCDFTGLHISVSQKLTDCIVTVLYKYPRLRSRICFIGSRKGCLDSMSKLISADDGVIRSFGIQHILTGENARQIGQAITEMLSESDDSYEANVLAQAITTCGLIDGIMVDERDFGTKNIWKKQIELQASVFMKHSPKGCASVDSIIYHEIGHLLDFLCDVSEDDQLLAEYNGLSKSEIKSKLSGYAATSIAEFIADGFSEYMSSPNPRDLSKHVVATIDRCYQKLDNNI